MDAFYIQFCQKVGKVVIGLFVNSLWFFPVNCSFPYMFFVSNRMNGQKSAMHVLMNWVFKLYFLLALIMKSWKWCNFGKGSQRRSWLCARMSNNCCCLLSWFSFDFQISPNPFFFSFTVFKNWHDHAFLSCCTSSC